MKILVSYINLRKINEFVLINYKSKQQLH